MWLGVGEVWLSAGLYVRDDDVRYIVEMMSSAI